MKFVLYVLALCLLFFIGLRLGEMPKEPNIGALVKDTLVIQKQQGNGIATGTGFPISSTLIVTNAHVVADDIPERSPAGPDDRVKVIPLPRTITVALFNGVTYPAEVVGESPDFDLAVLRIPENPYLTAMPIGNSNATEVGDPVWTLGNPEGLYFVASRGIVTKVDVFINSFNRIIQSDAEMNHGNSGGPLIDKNGAVIGINSMIANTRGNNGYSIEINGARRIWQRMIEGKTVVPITYGIQYGPNVISNGDAQRLLGVAVSGVMEKSLGEKMGLREGDIVVEVNHRAVINPGIFLTELKNTFPGDTLEFKVLRQGQTRRISMLVDLNDPKILIHDIPTRSALFY